MGWRMLPVAHCHATGTALLCDLALKLAAVIASANGNVHQNPLLEFFMQHSIMPQLLQARPLRRIARLSRGSHADRALRVWAAAAQLGRSKTLAWPLHLLPPRSTEPLPQDGGIALWPPFGRLTYRTCGGWPSRCSVWQVRNPYLQDLATLDDVALHVRACTVDRKAPPAAPDALRMPASGRAWVPSWFASSANAMGMLAQLLCLASP
jgi:hypothetical protein